MLDEPLIISYEIISDLTWQMLKAARCKDWTTLAGIEDYRAQLMDAVTTGKLGGTLTAVEQRRKTGIMMQVMQDDIEINALAKEHLGKLRNRVRVAANEQYNREPYLKAA